MNIYGLHVVHGALKTGFEKIQWDISSFLRSLKNLFRQAPARKSMYTEYTGSSVFPKNFCGTRWVENEDVALHALKNIDDVEKYVFKCMENKTVPNCKSFETVASAIKDKLLRLKLAFFYSMASMLEPFLREFQTDEPMAPFLYQETFDLTYSLLAKIVKPDVLSKCTKLYSLKLSYIHSKTKEKLPTDKIVKPQDFEMDFATKVELKKMKSFLSDKQILDFRRDMIMCIIYMAEKLLERSPLKYPFTKSISCFDPKIIVSDVGEATKRCGTCVQTLTETNRITGPRADTMLKDFKNLCKNVNVLEAMKSYKRNKTRLDNFWMDVIKLCDKDVSSLIELIKIVFILSHGNAAVERGFSVNSECIVENQIEKSLVAQRQVYDAVLEVGGMENFNIVDHIDNKMINAFKNSSWLYKEYLEKQKKEKENSDLQKLAADKKKLELMEMEKQKSELLSNLQKLNQEIEEKKNN